MRMPGRISAAIEVLGDVLGNQRPVSMALQAWGRGNRYAVAAQRFDAAASTEGSACPRMIGP